MRRIILAASLAAACVPADHSAPTAAIGTDAAPSRWIVLTEDGVNLDDLAPGAVRRRYYRVVVGGAVDLSPADADQLRHRPGIRGVWPDRPVRRFDVPWGIDRLDQPGLPLSGGYTPPPGGGRGVTIYITDTGALNHPDLAGRIGSGIDVIDGDFDSSSCFHNGHGMHVAGTAAGTATGIAPEATVVAVRMLDCWGNGTESGAIAALDWIVQQPARPAVVNASWGSGVRDAPMDAAVAGVLAAGIPFVAAAGNTAEDACLSSPGGGPGVLAVGATGPADQRTDWSAWGPCIAVFAPGLDILSDLIWTRTPTGTASGTSMAAPHVTGVVALLLAATPGLSPSQVAAAVQAHAVPVVTNLPPGTTSRLANVQGIGGSILSTVAPPNPVLAGLYAPYEDVRVTGFAGSSAKTRSGWTATVTTTLRDGAGAPVANGLVEGQITGRTQAGSWACWTNQSGQCAGSVEFTNKTKTATATLLQVYGPAVATYRPDLNVTTTLEIPAPRR